MTIYLIIALVLSYFIGCIPFGVIFAKILGFGDLRKVGSGNVGATNALRAGGKKLALLTLFGDVGKGAAAVILGNHFAKYVTLNSNNIGEICGMVAVLGHIYNIFLGFKGGKGVASLLGVLLACSNLLAICFVVIWLAVAVISRYSSLAALFAIAGTSIVTILDKNFSVYCGPMIIISLIITYKHSTNIARLFSGTESKIEFKSYAKK